MKSQKIVVVNDTTHQPEIFEILENPGIRTPQEGVESALKQLWYAWARWEAPMIMGNILMLQAMAWSGNFDEYWILP